MRAIALSALAYFGIVFSIGFVLGVVRVLWIEPAIGERNAELLEIPVMVAVSFIAAGLVLDRYAVPDNRAALALGIIALMLLVLVEFSVVLGIQGLTVAEYFDARDPVAGGAYALSLILFGVFPLIRKVMQKRHGS